MPFRLFYRGPLKSNGTPSDKHAIRMAFHSQLAEVWKQPNLLVDDIPKLLNRDEELNFIYEMDGVSYAPLVSERLFLTAELDILFLRPSDAGALIKNGGDIDNRLKTLFDGLRRPLSPTEIPKSFEPSTAPDPFFCLLSDDALITKIGVTTDRLLEVSDPDEVVLIITVNIKRTRIVIGNLNFME